MGFSLSWIAVENANRDAVRKAINACGTGLKSEFPEWEFSDAVLPNGWIVVVADHQETVVDIGVIRGLSKNNRLISCFVEEHVMISEASLWMEGECVWTIKHDSSVAIEHLVVSGTPPQQFQDIKQVALDNQRKQQSQQPGVDYFFDVPLALARTYCGFKHDESVLNADSNAFEELRITCMSDMRFDAHRLSSNSRRSLMKITTEFVRKTFLGRSE